MNKIKLYAALAPLLWLTACAGPVKQAEEYAAQDEWMKAVVEYRKAYASEPQNVE